MQSSYWKRCKVTHRNIVFLQHGIDPWSVFERLPTSGLVTQHPSHSQFKWDDPFRDPILYHFLFIFCNHSQRCWISCIVSNSHSLPWTDESGFSEPLKREFP
jgi:hypothetical protein